MVREPASKIILASRSPRRAELLSAAGFAFDVHATEIDETPRPGEPAAAYVERLAIDKAEAVFAELANKELVVLGADTTVVLS